MKGLRYMNVMLTVAALLLGLNLASQWALTPHAAQPALAQGIPDEGAQRLEIINLLKSLNQRMDNLEKLLVSGKVRVIATVPGAEQDGAQPAARRRPAGN